MQVVPSISKITNCLGWEDECVEMTGKAAPQQISNTGTPTSLVRVIAVLLMLSVAVGVLVLAMSSDQAGSRDYFEYWAVGHQLIHNQNPYDSKAIVQLVDRTEKRKNNRDDQRLEVFARRGFFEYDFRHS